MINILILVLSFILGYLISYIVSFYCAININNIWKRQGINSYYWREIYYSYDGRSLLIIWNADTKEKLFVRLYKTRDSAIRGAFRFMDRDANNCIYNQREIYTTIEEV